MSRAGAPHSVTTGSNTRALWRIEGMQRLYRPAGHDPAPQRPPRAVIARRRAASKRARHARRASR